MIYSLLVLSSPASGSGARNAALFAKAVIAAGHQIHRVFFLDNGTYVGGDHTVFAQDEDNPRQIWIELAENHGLDLVLCVASALKRGLLDAPEAQRHEIPGSTVHPLFNISGLGQLIDAGAHSDRLVTFGG